jgi:Cdc6-like AAA superfamily ATPase
MLTITSKLSSAIKADTDNIRNQLPLVQNGIENLRHEGALAQLNALKAWISRTDPVAEQSDISRRRCEGTGQWFLDTPEFVEWLGKSSIGRTLLCTGMPGAGKTILAAVAIDHLSRKRRCSTVGVAWLFLNYKSQREQTIEFILATILRQLVQLETPGTVEHARVLKQEHDKSITTPNETEYYKTLQAVLAEFDTVYIVVDALDESQEGTRRKLLDHTKALQKAADVCLLFTSRGIPDIANAFETASKLEIRAIDEDVKLFVADQMEALPNCIRKNDALRQLVQDSIARAIDGMYVLYFPSPP